MFSMWKLHGSVPGGPRRSSSTATARSSWPSACWQRSSRRTACTSLGASRARRRSRRRRATAPRSRAAVSAPTARRRSSAQRHHLAQAVDGERALAVRARQRRDVPPLLRVALHQLRRHQEELDRARRLEQLLVDQPERVVRVRHRETDHLEQHRDGLVPLAVRVVHRRLAQELLHRRLVLRRGHLGGRRRARRAVAAGSLRPARWKLRWRPWARCSPP